MFECGKLCFAGLTLAEEEHGGFGTGPAQMHLANLFARRAESLAIRLLGTCHQATIGDEILHARKAANVVPLIEEDQREDLPNPGNRLQPRKGLHLISFGTAGEREFHFSAELILLIDEGNVDFNRFADTEIRKMLRAIFAG